MWLRIIAAIIELPFKAVDKLVSSIIYTHRPRTDETAQVVELRRKIGRLFRINQEQANWILHMERKFKDAENRHKAENQQLKDRNRETERKYERQLSFERMRKQIQH